MYRKKIYDAKYFLKICESRARRVNVDKDFLVGFFFNFSYALRGPAA